MRRQVFTDRSRAIQEAVEEKLERLERTRLAEECAKFDPAFERVVTRTPNPLPDREILFVNGEWQRLRQAAVDAFRVFIIRGRRSVVRLASGNPHSET